MPHAIAIREDGQGSTYAEVEARVQRLAGAFRTAGVTHGDPLRRDDGGVRPAPRRIVAAAAASIVEEFAQRHERLPGFGHPLHKLDDPRTPALLALASEAGVKGAHAAVLAELSAAVDAARGRHLTVNATGAIAAVLLDCGVPAEIVRGFALVSRAAGLVGHKPTR